MTIVPVWSYQYLNTVTIYYFNTTVLTQQPKSVGSIVYKDMSAGTNRYKTSYSQQSNHKRASNKQRLQQLFYHIMYVGYEKGCGGGEMGEVAHITL